MKDLLITLACQKQTSIEASNGLLSITGLDHVQILHAAIATIRHAAREGLNLDFDFEELKKMIEMYECAFER